MDYYSLLGLDPLSDISSIQRAYRQQALKSHPDKNRGDPNAAENFRVLNEAYLILSDPITKAAFDEKFLIEKERKTRLAQLDARRLAMRQDLLEREKASSTFSSHSPEASVAQFHAEVYIFSYL